MNSSESFAGPFLCSYCGLTSTNGTTHAHFSFILIGQIMPAIAICGIFMNALVVFVFSRKTMQSSASTYLAGLGLSDCCLSLSAIFVFSFHRIKDHHPWINFIYHMMVREIFTLAMTVQGTSVYFTIAAAVDCYISICVKRLRKRYCRVRVAKLILCFILVLSIGYNVIHYFEMSVRRCYMPETDSNMTTVCATALRMNPQYIWYYYTLGYTVLMTSAPLVLLMCLNLKIFLKIKNQFRNGTGSQRSREDAVMLMAVVALFIICNLPALVINLVENFVPSAQARPEMSYVVDSSNLLVVINSSLNFIIYFFFGSEFRARLSGYAHLKTTSGAVPLVDTTKMEAKPALTPCITTVEMLPSSTV